MATQDNDTTIVEKGTSPSQTIVAKPSTPSITTVAKGTSPSQTIVEKPSTPSTTIVAKGTSPTQTSVPKPYTILLLAEDLSVLTTEDDTELQLEAYGVSL